MAAGSTLCLSNAGSGFVTVFQTLDDNTNVAKDQNIMPNNLVHSLTDAFALAAATLGNNSPAMTGVVTQDNALVNVFVTENGVRSLVRNKIPAYVASALVSSANHGANLSSSGRSYEVEQV